MNARSRLAIIFVIICTTVATLVTVVRAQGNRANCKPGNVIAEAGKLKSSGDTVKDLAALDGLVTAIHAQRIACDGFTFKGKGEKVLDPFVMPAGFYRATATTKGYLIVYLRSMDGSDCQPGVTEKLFNLDDQQASIGAETTLDLAVNCRLLLSTGNNRVDWTISFELIR